MKIKYTCKLCNKEFESIRNFVRHLKIHKMSSKEYYDKFLKQDNDGICQICGKPTEFFKFANGYRKTCSDNCYRQLCVKNWRKTMNEKYNGGYYAGTIECQNRMKETCKEKYGCEYVWQSDEIKEKRKNYVTKNSLNKNGPNKLGRKKAMPAPKRNRPVFLKGRKS